MSIVFRPSEPADEAQLLRLLAAVFQFRPNSALLDPGLLHWKYWSPRPGRPEPRSFVAVHDGRIVAHAGLWPLVLHTPAGPLRGAHMMDWAAEASASGSGLLLMQQLKASQDFLLAIGGSSSTLAILPRFGFRPAGQARTFARPLRPWRQIVEYPRRDWLLPARLARNSWWAWHPPAPEFAGWSYTAERDPAEPALVALEQCQWLRLLRFRILRDGRDAGSFALTVVGQQARLAGIWLRAPDSRQFQIAFQLAQDAAKRKTNALEFVARTADEDAVAAASLAGLRLRFQSPVCIYRKDTQAALRPHCQLCDNDSVFHPAGASTPFT